MSDIDFYRFTTNVPADGAESISPHTGEVRMIRYRPHATAPMSGTIERIVVVAADSGSVILNVTDVDAAIAHDWPVAVVVADVDGDPVDSYVYPHLINEKLVFQLLGASSSSSSMSSSSVSAQTGPFAVFRVDIFGHTGSS